jgi:hypothetical protein
MVTIFLPKVLFTMMTLSSVIQSIFPPPKTYLSPSVTTLRTTSNGTYNLNGARVLVAEPVAPEEDFQTGTNFDTNS